MTPAQRQTARITAGAEITHPETANGSLFVHKGAGHPTSGSVAYGVQRFTHQISEGVADGGVQTKDKFLIAALRSLGIYNETVL